MTTPAEEFKDLVAAAPLVPDVDRLIVIGILGRVADVTKFAVTVNGKTLTFKLSARKAHQVIPMGYVGQKIVEVELDPKNLSAEERASLSDFPALKPATDVTVAAADIYGSISGRTIAEVPPHNTWGPNIKAWAAWWDVGPGFGSMFPAAISPYILADPSAAVSYWELMSKAGRGGHGHLPKAQKDPGNDTPPE